MDEVKRNKYERNKKAELSGVDESQNSDRALCSI